MGPTDNGRCPFNFNFEPATFKPSDLVSYRVPDRFGDMPFVGVVVDVADDHVILAAHEDPSRQMRGTRESRPVVEAADALR